jgi:molybdopterin-biosynthesis enzyme MoeA-like protein
MARIPAGADLVENPISRAPGFKIGNVIVMAGVPAIMQAMLDNVAPGLVGGTPVTSVTIEAGALPEGLYAGPLGEIAKAHPALSIGSYPSYAATGFANRIVVRGREAAEIEAAVAEIRALVDRLTAERG